MSVATETRDAPGLPHDAQTANLTSETETGGDGSDGGAVPPEEGRTRLQTTVIMLSLCSALFLSALDVTIVTVAIPTISSEFHSTTGYTWIGSAYMLTNAAAAPSWGKLSDIWGRKQVLLLAVAVFWVGSLVSAVSTSMGMLIAGRAVQGAGGGGIVILVSVCISDLFSMRRRIQYFGLAALVWVFAGGIGPVLGGTLTDRVSWRWCFYINLPVSGIGFAVLFFVLRLHNPRTGLRQGLAAVDWLGSLAVIGGTLMILLALTLAGVVYPWRSPAVICLFVLGAACLALFVLVECRFARFPVIPPHLFRSRAALAAFGCCFFHGLVFTSGTYYLPLYFQAVLGASPLLSGVYILPYSICISAGSCAIGFVVRRTGNYYYPILAGCVLMTVGTALLTCLGVSVHWAACIVIQIVGSLGVGFVFQTPLLAVQAAVSPRDVASATATIGFIRQLATAISVVVGGVVFQNGMQRQQPALVARLGPDVAALLSGENAASSVEAVHRQLGGSDLAVAHAAYWSSLRDMFAMYAAFSGVAVVMALCVRQTKLSTVHEEQKTGLQHLVAREKQQRWREKPEQPEKSRDVEQGVVVTRVPGE